MNVTAKQRMALLALAQARHFGKAAESVSMSQPTLSRHIQSLEDQLGFTLFDRHTRAVSLTPMGHEIWQYFLQLEAFQSRAERRIQARSLGSSGHVAIAALPSLIGQIIAPVIRELKDSHPDLTVDIHDYQSSDIRKKVLLEQVDIGLDSPINDNFDGLNTQKLVEDELCVIVSNDHVLAKSDVVSFADLSEHDLVGAAQGTSLRLLTDQCFARANQTFRPKFEFEQIVSVLGIVKHNLAAGILPNSSGFTIPSMCRRIALKEAESRVTWLFTKRHVSIDPAVSQVVAAIHDMQKPKHSSG